MTRKLMVFELLLVAAAMAATAVLYSHLPPRVTTHWGLNGRPNGYSPRWMMWVLGPGFLAGISLLTAVLPWLSPRRFEVSSFRSTYLFIMTAVFVMMGYIYGVVLWAGSGRHMDIADIVRAVQGAVCLFFAVIGNVMGKVQRNFFIGVRTPWTLASERVWRATHRFAARCMVAAGLLGLVLVLAGVQLASIAVILAGALAPVVYSLVYYKHLERCGGL
jgi:uncharacterized membrane protein